MKTEHYARNWPGIQRLLKQRYPHLSDEQLALHEGREEESLARIRRHTNLSPAEFDKFATDCLVTHS